jgi:phage terminase large subunit
LIGQKIYKNQLWVHEYIYEIGMTNKALAERMEALGISKRIRIIADSANPKDIEDLRSNYGYFVSAAYKGQGSILNGIRKIKEYDVFLTSGSKNFWYEVQHYSYALDQFDKPTDMPIDANNHCIDPLRYTVYDKAIKIRGSGTNQLYAGR